MPDMRAMAERHLGITLEGAWAANIRLVPPDGAPFTARGQVLYDLARMDPETGERVVLGVPVVTLRRSSLRLVPQPGETWLIECPTAPTVDAPIGQYALSPMRAPEGGASIGFIRLYLQKVEQDQ